jgi:tRNA/tmRNA/rRNA uracil-C5-methylase (TrmA/RlmC/RlmD family)
MLPLTSIHVYRKKFRKRKLEGTEKESQRTIEQIQTLLYDQVTPLWKLTYAEQLELKTSKVISVLNQCVYRLREFSKTSDVAMKSRLDENKETRDCLLCPMREIQPSPIIQGYRNKYEFAIGWDEWGQVAVGFTLGAYRDGMISVQVSQIDQSFSASLL